MVCIQVPLHSILLIFFVSAVISAVTFINVITEQIFDSKEKLYEHLEVHSETERKTED